MLDILSIRRAEAEQFETQGRLVDRLSARSLSNYLDDRKTLATHAERADLAKQYGISVALLEDLAKHVNSPSVSNVPLRASGYVATAARTPNEGGRERLEADTSCTSACAQYGRG